MATKTKPTATAGEVRQWFRDHPNQIPTGHEKVTAEGGRGVISKACQERFNKRSGRVYAPGQEKTIKIPVPAVDKRGRSRTNFTKVPYSQARELAGKAGRKGFLGQADLVKAGEEYAKTLAKN